jgi:hypothetical protein
VSNLESCALVTVLVLALASTPVTGGTSPEITLVTTAAEAAGEETREKGNDEGSWARSGGGEVARGWTVDGMVVTMCPGEHEPSGGSDLRWNLRAWTALLRWSCRLNFLFHYRH